ncbi:unnamed protein product [Toxocara canis]|uniref:Glutamine amidotransferase type-2 domain-containing protein n=1 Tax=Toxocara canis TaxID=6265 RepID=A0A183V1P3_TOXCA|nr:unnamed protein product [Toxocara canis]
MCGIFAICHCKCDGKRPSKFSLEEAQKYSRLQIHRGPDFHGSYQNETTGDILRKQIHYCSKRRQALLRRHRFH